jgi:hypothetical protein
MSRHDPATGRVQLDPSASARAHDDRTNLTDRQLDVLLHCLGRGYYEIPRRSTLRALGLELGITATSLSLLLRRAEAKIIQDFGERNGARTVSPGKVRAPAPRAADSRARVSRSSGRAR